MLFIWVHEKFVQAHMIFDLKLARASLLGNTAHLLVASMISVAMPQMSRDLNPAITTYSVI
jgi:hypothetical protein